MRAYVRVQRSRMIHQRVREDMDDCDHPRVAIVVPDTGGMDVEGGVIELRCLSCDAVLEEGVMYE